MCWFLYIFLMFAYLIIFRQSFALLLPSITKIAICFICMFTHTFAMCPNSFISTMDIFKDWKFIFDTLRKRKTLDYKTHYDTKTSRSVRTVMEVTRHDYVTDFTNVNIGFSKQQLLTILTCLFPARSCVRNINDEDYFCKLHKHAGHTRKASWISKAAVDNCGKGMGNFYLS